MCSFNVINVRHFKKSVRSRGWRSRAGSLICAGLSGSFTIEASVIIPLSLFIIASLIILSFYLHDQVIIKTIPVSVILEDPFADSGELESSLAQELSARLIITSSAAVSLSSEYGQAEASVSAEIKDINPVIKYLTGSSTEDISFRASIKDLDGRQALLKEKTISDAARRITGDE